MRAFKINFNKLYNSTGNYLSFMLPGLLGAIMQQVIFLAMALVFARDFEDGYFKELVKVKKWSVYHIGLKATPFLLMLPVMWFIVSQFFVFFNVEADIFNIPMLILTPSYLCFYGDRDVVLDFDPKSAEGYRAFNGDLHPCFRFKWIHLAEPCNSEIH